MEKRISREWLLIIILVSVKLALHFATNTNYELHRDAYLYLAESEHLDWGFWSEPPLTAAIGRITRIMFGDSVFSIRLFPALAGAASVLIIGLMIRGLGGKSWAIALGAGAFVLSPAFLRSNTLFQPVSFDIFFWLLACYFIVRLLQSQNPKFWLPLILVWALGFYNKYNIAFLVLAFFLALLLTRQRKLLASKYFLYGAILAVLLVLPNLIWQLNHKFPVIAHMIRLRETQLVHVQLSDFVNAQFLMNFPGLPVWLAGLVFLLFAPGSKKYRVVGLTFLAVMLLFILLKGKGYYALGIYPILFGFGGLALEQYLRRRLRILKPIVLALMFLLLLPLLPYSLPVYPLEKMIVYGEQSKKFGGEGALRWEDGRIHRLPQDYADMVGWQELAEVVIRTYHSLSDSERAVCAISADNYGQAGAIKFHGQKAGLPEPICFDGSFLFWAPDSARFSTLIYVNDDTADVAFYFNSVVKVGEITNPYARETGLPVYLCRGPRNGFAQFYAEKVAELKRQFRR